MLKLSPFISIAIVSISIIIIVMCAYFKSIKEGLTNKFTHLQSKLFGFMGF